MSENRNGDDASGRWRSCSSHKKRRKMSKNGIIMPAENHNNKVVPQKRETSKKETHDPCNPLNYVFIRQLNDKVNYCNNLVDARFSNAENFFRKDLYSHYGCVNAIEFSHDGDLLISGGDDKRILLWQVQKAINDHGKPTVMKAQHSSNIFCLGYNSSRTKIFSGGNDDQVILHDLETTDVLNFFRHEKAVYGLDAHPHNDNVFSSACDDGRVLIYDTRGSASSPESFFCLAQYKNFSFHSVMFNPIDPVTLVTANAKEGVALWDVRKPLNPVLRYGSEGPAQSCMHVRYNHAGTLLLAIRRRLPPVIYPVNSATHLYQFDQFGYYNSCTMKSCCFAGNNDEYVLSGSDDFNLYMWKIPTDDSTKWVESAHMTLQGHRSIVNQVRYNSANCVLASSGVEKIIKLWSPFSLGEKCSGGLKKDDDREEKQRRVYSHDEYIGLVLRSGQVMTHDYSHQSTDEDQRMMAFFDSLVQREIESWSSEDVPTPPSPSDPDNSNASDSDDYSTPSDNDFMRCFFSSTLTNARNAANNTERPADSPNRIAQLIANRREKLMRLAALENGCSSSNQSKTSITTSSSNNTTTSASSSISRSSCSSTQTTPDSTISQDKRSNEIPNSSKSKSKKHLSINTKSKVIKRKHNKYNQVSRRTRSRRKLNDAKYSSSSEDEENSITGKTVSHTYTDETQPSTSTGVISSNLLRYNPTPEPLDSHQSYSSSYSNSDHEQSGIKGKLNRAINGDKNHTLSKSDSDSPNQVALPKKRKNSRKTVVRRSKSKRQKVECNFVEHQNGATPTKNLMLQLPTSSDSGITSSVSTVEKSRIAESPDYKHCEKFKKRVDKIRRNFRKRVMTPKTSSSESDNA